MILTLITVGKTLEAYSKGKTTNALKSLMDLAPQTACLVRDGQQVTVPIGRSTDRRHLPGAPGREHPGRRRCAGRRIQRERSRPDRREHAGGQGRGRHGQRRHHQPERRADLPRHPRGPGHDAVPGLSAWCRTPPPPKPRWPARPTGSQGSLCRPSSAIAAVTLVIWLLLGFPVHVCARARHQRAGHQLPVRAWPGDAGGDHGRLRRGRQAGHPVQDPPPAWRRPATPAPSCWTRPAP